MICIFLQCVSTVIIVLYHYKSTELVSLYTLEIGFKYILLLYYYYGKCEWFVMQML